MNNEDLWFVFSWLTVVACGAGAGMFAAAGVFQGDVLFVFASGYMVWCGAKEIDGEEWT